MSTFSTREGAGEPVVIDYTNHRGERSSRLIFPIRMWFGVSDWHPNPQWFVRAIDLRKQQARDFAMLKIHGWFTWETDDKAAVKRVIPVGDGVCSTCHGINFCHQSGCPEDPPP